MPLTSRLRTAINRRSHEEGQVFSARLRAHLVAKLEAIEETLTPDEQLKLVDQIADARVKASGS